METFTKRNNLQLLEGTKEVYGFRHKTRSLIYWMEKASTESWTSYARLRLSAIRKFYYVHILPFRSKKLGFRGQPGSECWAVCPTRWTLAPCSAPFSLLSLRTSAFFRGPSLPPSTSPRHSRGIKQPGSHDAPWAHGAQTRGAAGTIWRAY